jgi:mannose-6-phosphate isomerase-like protein (cupin superfamily)
MCFAPTLRNFKKIADGVDVQPLLDQLAAHPELWGMHGWRKKIGVHSQMSDIWVRFAEREEDFHRPHFGSWYPAYRTLPALEKLIFDAMAAVRASHLGGVLITRIPPGGKILPHIDRGWHPEFMNTKLYYVLKTNQQCVFRVEDERVTMDVGDCWQIDNTREHDVVNDGDSERMTLIVCTRVER